MSIIKRKAGSEDIVKSVLEFDEVPTEGSPNLVESGAVAQAIGNSGKAKTEAIATEYTDLTFPVAAGTACMHDGLRYVANATISTSEDWTAAHWTETSVEDEIIRIDSLWQHGFQDATKKFTFNLLSKYQTYFGNFTVKLKYNFLTGLYVVTGSMNVTSTFTPSYSTSDPAGSATWPCVAEADFDEEPINDATGNFLLGDIINPSPYINVYKINIDKVAKKAFLIMSANKAVPGNNWFDFYSASSF